VLHGAVGCCPEAGSSAPCLYADGVNLVDAGARREGRPDLGRDGVEALEVREYWVDDVLGHDGYLSKVVLKRSSYLRSAKAG
jgi:hypothetical protein